MKKIVSKVAFLSTILFPYITFAEKLGENTTDTSPQEFVMRIVDFVIIFAGALAVLFIMIGGLQYITSMGNEEKTTIAKRTLLYAIIGLLIVILSLTIINVIQSNINSVL